MRATMKLTPENVHRVFLECLHTKEEIEKGVPKDGEFIGVHGLTMNIGFHPERISKNKKHIGDMLAELPPAFMKDIGGGWTFLYMCEDKDGEQWTGDHRIMEELVLLGLATEQAEFVLPRETWSALPGGVPYISVNVSKVDA